MALTPPKRKVTDAENKLRLLCCIEALGGVTPSQLWPFVASLDLMEYMPMQLLLHELTQGGDVEEGTQALYQQLFLTDQGRQTLSLFDQRIMASDRQQIRMAAAPYRAQLRQKAQLKAVYELAQAGDYRVLLTLQEGELPLLTLRLRTPDRDLAALAMRGFQAHASDVLTYLYRLPVEEAHSAPQSTVEKEGHAFSELICHSRHEHTVTTSLPHPRAPMTLSLLLPDAYAARAYQQSLANPAQAASVAQRLAFLLWEKAKE